MVRLVNVDHNTGGTPVSVIASHVEVAATTWAKSRGLMFRSQLLDDHAVCFEWADCQPRLLHMLAVPFALQAIWTDTNNRVTHVKRLAPMLGWGVAPGCTVYEVPAGAADNVDVGDRVVMVPDSNNND